MEVMDGSNHNDLLEAFEQASKPGVGIDIEKYQSMLDASGMNEAQKREFLEALWSIIVAFVDLGFGVHPIQETCGKLPQRRDQHAHADSAALDSKDIEEDI